MGFDVLEGKTIEIIVAAVDGGNFDGVDAHVRPSSSCTDIGAIFYQFDFIFHFKNVEILAILIKKGADTEGVVF